MAQRIGEFLVQIGAMTQDQVDEIINLQHAGDEALFGWLAIERGYINDEVLRRFVDEQSVREPAPKPGTRE